jgi:hypothetical protein
VLKQDLGFNLQHHNKKVCGEKRRRRGRDIFSIRKQRQK